MSDDDAGPGFVPPWDGADYAANTAHHRAFDAGFLASTPLKSGDRVLDLGCGSGDLTAAVADLVPDGHVVGVDAQPSMLDQARTRARPNQSFVLAAAQRLPDDLGRLDVVLSRAVLHWVPRAEWPGVLAGIAGHLRPGGVLRVECGGAGNTARVVALLGDASGGLPCPWTFLDPGTAYELLEDAGFEPDFVRVVGQRRPFDEASLLGWLRSQVLQAYEASLPADRHAHFRADVEARIGELRRSDGTLDQTFARLDLLARRL